MGEEGWIDDTDYVAQPYTEPNWDNDGANVEQGGWGDDQYTQVELDGLLKSQESLKSGESTLKSHLPDLLFFHFDLLFTLSYF